MTPSRPYFIRAVYEWVLDNDLTPYLLVNANYPQVMVPDEFVSEGKIVLNLAPSAIRQLNLGNTDIQFSARFGGRARNLHVPIGAVLAIYAKENGKGMFFDDQEIPPPGPPGGDEPGTPRKPTTGPAPVRPSLKVVK